MTRTVLVSVLCCCAVLLGAQERDRLILKGQAFNAFVDRETTEGIEYRVSAKQTRVSTKRWSEVVDIIYAGMESGYYQSGMDFMAAGRYEEAAQRFQALASSATREWEGAYGYLRLGEAWDLAGAYEEAAAAFGTLCATYPEHRFWMDAKYRQGIALAQAGKDAEAKACMDDLKEYRANNPNSGRGPELRSSAIETVIAAVGGDVRGAKGLARKVAFRPSDGDTWFHWGTFWAGWLRAQGEFRDAAREYERMLPQLAGDPAKQAKVSLGFGICLANDGQKEAALLELLKLDALPYGSPEERCEAQYWAGRLMWETGSEKKDDPDAKVNEFANQKLKSARALLAAAASSISDSPAKQLAADFIQTLPAQPGAEGDAPEGG
jgi:tetratricopeptide (TPR) repeat protein